MFRIAKPENFILISPSRQQIASMRAIECIPLVMEPESRFYEAPVVVVDFQSLYPSCMIAYNYCFSTCLGKVSQAEDKDMGFSKLQVPPAAAKGLASDITSMFHHFKSKLY